MFFRIALGFVMVISSFIPRLSSMEQANPDESVTLTIYDQNLKPVPNVLVTLFLKVQTVSGEVVTMMAQRCPTEGNGRCTISFTKSTFYSSNFKQGNGSLAISNFAENDAITGSIPIIIQLGVPNHFWVQVNGKGLAVNGGKGDSPFETPQPAPAKNPAPATAVPPSKQQLAPTATPQSNQNVLMPEAPVSGTATPADASFLATSAASTEAAATQTIKSTTDALVVTMQAKPTLTPIALADPYKQGVDDVLPFLPWLGGSFLLIVIAAVILTVVQSVRNKNNKKTKKYTRSLF